MTPTLTLILTRNLSQAGAEPEELPDSYTEEDAHLLPVCRLFHGDTPLSAPLSGNFQARQAGHDPDPRSRTAPMMTNSTPPSRTPPFPHPRCAWAVTTVTRPRLRRFARSAPRLVR